MQLLANPTQQRMLPQPNHRQETAKQFASHHQECAQQAAAHFAEPVPEGVRNAPPNDERAHNDRQQSRGYFKAVHDFMSHPTNS